LTASPTNIEHAKCLIVHINSLNLSITHNETFQSDSRL
jgi:hypothetical protein